jgi:hypothetical protein
VGEISRYISREWGICTYVLVVTTVVRWLVDALSACNLAVNRGKSLSERERSEKAGDTCSKTTFLHVAPIDLDRWI